MENETFEGYIPTYREQDIPSAIDNILQLRKLFGYQVERNPKYYAVKEETREKLAKNLISLYFDSMYFNDRGEIARWLFSDQGKLIFDPLLQPDGRKMNQIAEYEKYVTLHGKYWVLEVRDWPDIPTYADEGQEPGFLAQVGRDDVFAVYEISRNMKTAYSKVKQISFGNIQQFNFA